MTTFVELSYTRTFNPNPLKCRKNDIFVHGLEIAEYQKLVRLCKLLYFTIIGYYFYLQRPLLNGILSEPLTGTIEFDSFGRRRNFKLQVVDLYNGRYRYTGDWSSENPDHIKPLTTPTNDTVYITDTNLQKGIVRVAAKYVKRGKNINSRSVL